MMSVQYLSAQESEVLARTIEQRTSVKGCVECHGLRWQSNALLEWENRQRDAGKQPKVNVCIDELDLHVVYIEYPDTDRPPTQAISLQPEFTRGLSIFELNRLKKATKQKELADRLGRLSDREASALRLEYYARLGHGDDPVAQRRLSEAMHALNDFRRQRDSGHAMLTSEAVIPAKPKKHKPQPVAVEPPTRFIPLETSPPPPAQGQPQRKFPSMHINRSLS